MPNSRNGTTPKTVHSEVGSIPLDIPRDRNSTFEPRLVPKGERLQKVLAQRGYGSRRVCEELIAAGRVTVNDEVAVLGRRVDPDRDRVEVDGRYVSVRPDHVYYLLNKPRGVVTTASDPQGRRTVVQLVPSETRVFPVGRLDADTEGLLLLTNDGELTNRLTHPSYGVEKEYLAEVTGGPVSARALRRLRDGGGHQTQVDEARGDHAPGKPLGTRARHLSSLPKSLVLHKSLAVTIR